MTRQDSTRPVDCGSDRSDQLTRAYYAAAPQSDLAPLEDIGFSVMAVLTSMLVGAIAFS